MRRKNARTAALLVVGIISLSVSSTSVYANTGEENSVPDIQKDGVEYVDNENTCYFESSNGMVFEFDKVYVLEDGVEFSNKILETEYCKGVVCRLYTGENEPEYVHPYGTELFSYDVEGTFEYEGEIYSYCLIPPAEMMQTDRRKILEIIVDLEPISAEYIASYDYNKDGAIRVDDLVLFNKRYMSTPFNFVSNLSINAYDEMEPDAFFEILNSHNWSENKEIRICYDDMGMVVSTGTSTTTTISETTTSTSTTTASETTTSTSTTTTSETTTSASTTTASETTTSTSTTTASETITSTSTTTASETTTSTSTTTASETTTRTSTTTTSETTTSTSTTTTSETTTSTSTTTTRRSTTQSSTTTTGGITTSTTVSSNEWVKPKKEDLVHNGKQIDDDTYNILINTAKLYGIDKYEIVWSDHPIKYAYTNPGEYYCMKNGLAYGYGVQIADGKDIDTLCPNMSSIQKSMYKDNKYMCYRPLVPDDNLEYVLNSYESRTFSSKTDSIIVGGIEDIIEPYNIETDSEYYIMELDEVNNFNEFMFINWYLIPINDNEQILEINYPSDKYDTSVNPAISTKYWFTNEELQFDGIPVGKIVFNKFLFTAKQFNFKGFKIVYNASETEPIYYSFAIQGIESITDVMQGCVQIVNTEDILSLIDVKEKCLERANGNESLAEKYYEEWLDSNRNPVYYWTKSENVENINSNSDENISVFMYTYTDSYKHYVMIPTDENGNEDLRLFIS